MSQSPAPIFEFTDSDEVTFKARVSDGEFHMALIGPFDDPNDTEIAVASLPPNVALALSAYLTEHLIDLGKD